ncbi:MAG TPA: hypothetical protein VMT43_08815 [Acidimicrobiales bacterium]|nr:hypothetical protein [Acidimicrobiales bacterium]
MGNLTVAVRSVTVSPSSFTITCGGGGGALLFPNDHCTSPTLTVTNGAANALIDVSVSNFAPNDQGKAWVPCGAFGGTACTSGISNIDAPGRVDPGPDQFTVSSGNQIGYDGSLRGDIATGFVSVAPGHSWIEGFELYGPQSSTDQSLKWKLRITWWALPTS